MSALDKRSSHSASFGCRSEEEEDDEEEEEEAVKEEEEGVGGCCCTGQCNFAMPCTSHTSCSGGSQLINCSSWAKEEEEGEEEGEEGVGHENESGSIAGGAA